MNRGPMPAVHGERDAEEDRSGDERSRDGKASAVVSEHRRPSAHGRDEGVVNRRSDGDRQVEGGVADGDAVLALADEMWRNPGNGVEIADDLLLPATRPAGRRDRCVRHSTRCLARRARRCSKPSGTRRGSHPFTTMVPCTQMTRSLAIDFVEVAERAAGGGIDVGEVFADAPAVADFADGDGSTGSCCAKAAGAVRKASRMSAARRVMRRS